MKIVKVPVTHCHQCLQPLAGGTHRKQQAPQPGDFAVCTHCSTLYRFNIDLTLRPVTHEEWDALDVEIRNEIWAVRKLILEALTHEN